MKKKNRLIIALLIILVLGVVGVGFYVFCLNKEDNKPQNPINKTITLNEVTNLVELLFAGNEKIYDISKGVFQESKIMEMPIATRLRFVAERLNKTQIKTVDCSTLNEKHPVEDGKELECGWTDETGPGMGLTYVINALDLQAKYKDIFGTEIDFKNENFNVNYTEKLYYYAQSDTYVYYIKYLGGGNAGPEYNHQIKDYKIENNILNVNVEFKIDYDIDEAKKMGLSDQEISYIQKFIYKLDKNTDKWYLYQITNVK